MWRQEGRARRVHYSTVQNVQLHTRTVQCSGNRSRTRKSLCTVRSGGSESRVSGAHTRRNGKERKSPRKLSTSPLGSARRTLASPLSAPRRARCVTFRHATVRTLRRAEPLHSTRRCLLLRVRRAPLTKHGSCDCLLKSVVECVWLYETK